jgi:hypothetical protein
MSKQQIMWIVWPAFVVAGILEVLIFAMVDPQDLHWLGHPLELSRQGVYTVSFFIFWLITAVASGLTLWLSTGRQSD